jgi:hypothetical protein
MTPLRQLLSRRVLLLGHPGPFLPPARVEALE